MHIEQGNGAGQQRLGTTSFLSVLSPEAVAAFDAIKVTTAYPAGAVVFVEGEAPHGVFVLAAGRTKLSIGSANGKVMILRIAREGEILGLHAAVSGAPFQATAQTVEPCRLSFVRREEFLRFLREHPQASLEAAKQLSSSYQDACEQLRAIGLCDSARKKVARFVLEWIDNGHPKKDGDRATLSLTHEEIGQLIGTSRETITRALGDFKTRRWILMKGSTLMVQDKAALRELVGYDFKTSFEPPQGTLPGGGRLPMGSHSPVL